MVAFRYECAANRVLAANAIRTPLLRNVDAQVIIGSKWRFRQLTNRGNGLLAALRKRSNNTTDTMLRYMLPFVFCWYVVA